MTDKRGLVERLRARSGLAEGAICCRAADRITELEAEVERLRRGSSSLRQVAKRAGRDLLREEADAALPHFKSEWEPLRKVADRMGCQSAAWLAGRARDLQRRGLIESKWLGAERTSSFKVWRLAVRAALQANGGSEGA